MSMGFAAILMGMIEDFGVIGLHDWLEHPKSSFWETHRRVFPGIFWSALTSALVFGSLAFSVMPGIAQLGILTGVGILVGAVVMLYGFLPLAMKFSTRSHDKPRDIAKSATSQGWRAHLPALSAAGLCIFCVISLAWKGLPGVYREANILHPTHCQAMDGMMRLQEKMQPPELLGEWLPVLVHATTEAELCTSLATARTALQQAQQQGEISSFYLPESLAPNQSYQTQNFPLLTRLIASKEQAFKTAEAAGFITDEVPKAPTDQNSPTETAPPDDEKTDSLILAKQIFANWETWLKQPLSLPQWPDHALMEGSLGKILQLKPGSMNASGFLRMPPGGKPAESPLVKQLETLPGIYPGGWNYLKESLKPLLALEIRRVCLPAGIILLVLLVFVFKNVREITLVLASILFSGLILLATMSAFGIEWNFVNIGAVPLSLGLGLDFNIHMIYALRRLHTNAEATANGIGRALAYCGLSTGLGFGALAMSGNRGLITFGQCAMIGVLATLFTAAFLLPWAWMKWQTSQK
jgi:predicted exporter